jgi:hypothetical protein
VLSKALKTLFLDYGFTSFADNSAAVADAVIAAYGTNEITKENAKEFFATNQSLGDIFLKITLKWRSLDEITVEKTRVIYNSVTDPEREAQCSRMPSRSQSSYRYGRRLIGLHQSA